MSKASFIGKLRKKPVILLVVLLGAFFLKEVFLTDLFPMFTGQDEARHYNTVQYLAYPRLSRAAMSAPSEKQNKGRLETYNFSNEIKNTIVAAGLDANRENSFNQMDFAPGSYVGKNEAAINANRWVPVNETYPPDIASGGHSLYHKLASFIERFLAGESILVRFYAARLFSVLLGTLAVLFFYLTLKNFGLSEKATLAMTAIAAFQPRFSIYYTSVNYDALLILAFAAFAWAGTLILKNGANWKNLLVMLASALVGYLDKPTGIVLVAASIFMLAWLFWQKFGRRISSGKNKFLPLIVFAIAALIILFFFGKYLPFEQMSFSKASSSLGEYLSKSLTPGHLSLTARTYWGTLSWTDSVMLDKIVDIIRFVELVSLVGLIWFLLSKKTPAYLPEKKYIWFAIFMIVSLQLGIRVADWKVFADSGTLALGTPGRYFIPNLALHIALVSVGLGMLLEKFPKSKDWFENILALGAVLMFSFVAYLIFNVIAFRFYL